jgi:hypothetical protein
MKTTSEADTVRLNCKIRSDIKSAMEALAAQRHRQEGGYVGLTRLINEACMLLLEQETIPIEPIDPPPVKPMAVPRRKPAKSLTKRRKSEVA